MATVPCPSCGKDVSVKAFDCPSCGHPLRKAKRGFFGKVFKWAFVLFNIVMIAMLFSYADVIGDQMDTAKSDAEKAGTAIGATLGSGMLLTLWAIGDIILGMFVLFTRPKK